MLVRTQVSDQIPIPHESGQWMKFRKLNDKRIQDAVDARTEAGAAKLRAKGKDQIALDMEIRAVVQQARAAATPLPAALGATSAPAPPVEPKPIPPEPVPLTETQKQYMYDAALSNYDRPTLLTFGIAEWSYAATDIPAELKDENGGLDPKTSRWAAIEILRYNELLPTENPAGN